ncbi:nanos homolog 1-like [Chaetodon trifascialis]|uniref:nanos homolog 1-like n=1 Tax=Chaetodon trifascialis TaxID=109706 RepID=UPI00399454EA
MTTQGRVGVRSALSDGDCFDMWHDYMSLARLLGELCTSREGDRRDTVWPERDAAADPCVHVGGTGRESSTETSSLSDTSSEISSGYCGFCQQNGESPRVYTSHNLKSGDGKVICPILWNYSCPICEATGDRAHTRSHCPQRKWRRGAAKELPKKLPKSVFW